MESKTTIKGLEQGRAEFAYECAKKGSEIEKKKEYKAYVKKIPMFIKTNGLGSTFAFINSKNSKDVYQLIYNQTKEWLNKDDKKLINIKEDDDLVEKIISLNSPEYRAVTIEVLAFFNWLRRFADGLIEEEAENE